MSYKSGWVHTVLWIAGTFLLSTGIRADAQADHPTPEPGMRTTQPSVVMEEGSVSAIAVTGPQAPRILDAERHIPLDILDDHLGLWSSPLRIRRSALPWLLPLAGITTGALITDTALQPHLPESPRFISSSADFSDIGAAAAIGISMGFYLGGRAGRNPHAIETGILSAEALANSYLMSTELKYLTGRQRPGVGDGRGRFREGGSSFPSEHAAAAWSVATVVAHEYPGWLTKTLAYGGASAVSLSRVTGRRHFLSDALMGSALGYVAGRQALRRSDDSDRGRWGTFVRGSSYESLPDPLHQGSAYVPLDSWIYDALDRLSALGYGPSGFQNMRPWTRIECARLLQEMRSGVDSASDSQITAIYAELQTEFAYESRVLRGERNLALTPEAVYTRSISISGPPLTDGLHFGQTLINDYGRPYQRGTNVITGMSGHAEAGPFAIYARAEYQHVPLTPALPDSVRIAIAGFDRLPVAPALPFREIDRLRLMDAYVALNTMSWQFSFGKQSLWWGPTKGGELTFSNNAEPITMLRLSRTTPLRLPGVLGLFGEIRTDSFLGQLGGYHFLRLTRQFVLTGSYDRYVDPQPYIWGHKIALQPTPNLQLGVSWTTVFAGQGRPLTLDTFLHTFSFHGNDQAMEPGDRRTGFDFSYRIPGLRNWLVLYNSSMAEDQPNPIVYPRHSAMNPGIYFPRLPKVPKLDLRIEAVYTNLPNNPRPRAHYTNVHYAGGYTNNGQIMGSWIGPDAQGAQAQSTYWFSGRKKLQLGFRNQFLAGFTGGGRLRDYMGRYDFQPTHGLTASASVQFEQWTVPVLANGTQNVVAVSLQLTYQPRIGIR